MVAVKLAFLQLLTLTNALWVVEFYGEKLIRKQDSVVPGTSNQGGVPAGAKYFVFSSNGGEKLHWLNIKGTPVTKAGRKIEVVDDEGGFEDLPRTAASYVVSQ